MPNESWMEYLHRIEVFTEQGVEMCGLCNKSIGEVQVFGVIRGEIVPDQKFCKPCHKWWKKNARLVVR